MAGRRSAPACGAGVARAVGTCALVVTVSACASLGGGQMRSELARADLLLSIGCYACLDEAVHIYERALARRSGNRHVRDHAQVAYTLMAFRERELGLPESAARQRATARSAATSALSVAVFELVLDALGDQHDPRGIDSAATSEAIAAVADLLASGSSRNLAAAYALATLACPAPDAPPPSTAGARGLTQMREQNLALRYAELRCSSSMPAADLDALIAADRRFAEAHYIAAMAELQHGRVLSAHEHLRRASAALPGSSVVTIALANVNLALARFDEALDLYDRALESAEPPPAALLGRAKALTYLERHREALELLDVLLEDTEWMPGEKYYWRAWNLYRLSRYAAARRDVLRALESWSAAHVEQLAGLIALGLARHGEARVHFGRALELNADDCESQLYLAQIDSHARAWDRALDGSSAAASCFTKVLAHRHGDRPPEGETVEAAAREVHRLERWRASSIYSAAISAKVLGQRELALDHAKRLLDDPELGGLARDFIYDIDVPASPHHPSLIGPAPSGLRPGS